jgi:hypothetical protein
MSTGSAVALSTKLGIVAHSTLAIFDAPVDFHLVLPPEVRVRRRAGGSVDVVLAFFVNQSAIARRIEALESMMYPSGGLWIAWPKRASAIANDVSDHAVRKVLLPRGLVDNKVCAVDLRWTALRFVWRLERRPESGRR